MARDSSLRKYWRLQKKYLSLFKKEMIFLAISLFTNLALTLVNPQVIRYYVDTIATSTDTKTLTYAALIYIGVSLLSHFFYLSALYFGVKIVWGATNRLRFDLTKHCINLDMTFHNKYKPGEMIERIDGDVLALSNFFSRFTFDLIGSILLIIGIIVAYFIEGWIFGVAFTGFTIVALIALYLVRNFTSKYWQKLRDSTAKLFGFVEEGITATEDIQSLGSSNHIMKKFHDYSRVEFGNTIRAEIADWTFRAVGWGMLSLSVTLVFIICIPLFNNSILSSGTIFMILSYVYLLLRPIQSILAQLQVFQQINANINRINEFFEVESKIDDQIGEDIPTGKFELEFNKINFSYIKEEQVLRNVSFNVHSNRCLGIVGKTGSGKTTIAKLIFRLYEVNKGSIKIKNKDIKKYNLKSLRNEIEYVTQEVEIFNASLRDNVTLFNKTVPDELIEEVLINLGLEKWYNKLPNGLETGILSEQGLSAGEEQLIALTRAFLKNPQLIVLDEASSRLDPATEQLINRALAKLLHGRCSIIIAHRLSTLNKVDDILVLEKGEVLEFGSREELAKNPDSQFSILLQKSNEGLLQ
ncbi:MAG: ABC transporter ATP-binding protein [Asgard group archaeon]|nr:ABC transporter ATP-binding protein [Asgard group archaeon]